jgi:hypothetical protein
MEIIRFLQWQWRQFDTWYRFYLLAICLISFGYGSENDYVIKAGFGILFLMLSKWLFIDQTIKSYNEYKRQRDGLFKEIKGE